MPVLRYFVFVGGALCALLLAVNAVISPSPGHDNGISSNAELPVIRIHSDRKGPEAVVFDTTQPTIVPPAVAKSGPFTRTPMAAESGMLRWRYSSATNTEGSSDLDAGGGDAGSGEVMRQVYAAFPGTALRLFGRGAPDRLAGAGR